ncbi:MAG TPA: glycosyltransferase family 39 protein [Pyrinomonadaceae bacterium]|nr:glycosyltransferase family 39 protein [Pyrinomonadaceae bacterium]
MATGSTKSGRKQRQQQTAGAPRGPWAQPDDAATQTPAAHAPAEDAISRRTWLVAAFAIMAVAFLFRVVVLELRPMHHDEGVNGHFLLALLRSGNYRYDPSNYHGPTLYYFTLPLAYAAQKADALGTWVVRLVPLVFGVATVWLGFKFRRYVGTVGALAAAALMAVSPGMVFFSRYFIHEMMFVFFTVAAVVAAIKFYEAGEERTAAGDADGKWRTGSSTATLYGLGAVLAAAGLAASSLWLAYNPAQLKLGLAAVAFAFAATLTLLWVYDGARSIHLVLGAVSTGLLFATKETAFISVGVILIAWASTEIWLRIAARLWPRREQEARPKKGRDRRAPQTTEAAGPRPLRVVERLGGWPRVILLAAVSAGLFLFVNVLYFSSFFTNPKGVGDSIEAYKIWKKTGESGFHGYRWYKYFQWLFGDWNVRGEWEFGEEPLLLTFAALGFAFSLWRTRRRFPLFAALWGFGLLAAYSLIKYKTPWLVLSMLPPFALAAGYAFDALYRRRGWRVPALALLGLCLAVAAFQSYRVNFVNYDDDRYPYVYAHTKRSFHDLIAQIGRIAERTGDKQNASLNVAVENQEYWPLPWYMRDFKRVGYIGRVAQTTDDMVLVKDKQVPELEAALGARYRRVGDTYELRPGVKLVLFARSELVPY